MKEEKPITSAVALRYDRGRSDAPQLVAKGKGEVAARIIDTARQAGVQVVEDRDLLELLARVPLGREIPIELYQAVAEILAFVYRVDQRYRSREQ
jgi:flagellar biosynthesis protein